MPADLSNRSQFERRLNRLTRAVKRARAAGHELDDLTASNPTTVGLNPPDLSLLGDPRGARYHPESLGSTSARAAIAEYYARHGYHVDIDRIGLTASTSEAYSWLFKLLCDSGDGVLVPEPAYPLLPMLAQLEQLELERYPLLRDEAWRPDLGALRRSLREHARLRIIVVVNPGNPTGAFLRSDDAEELFQLAEEHDVAVLVDEVFADYAHDADWPRFVSRDRGLCFALNGLSKVALLPQAKLGWFVASGEGARVSEAMRRLEIIGDTYLSVSTAVQLAAPALLRASDGARSQLLTRIRGNLTELDGAIQGIGEGCPVRRLRCAGGWYAVVEVPRSHTDDEWVERLIEQARVIVHPGYFFDLDQAGVMVVSLIAQPHVFAPAIRRAVRLWSE